MIARPRGARVLEAAGDPELRDALRNVIAASRFVSAAGDRPQVVGVTSPGHGEGKTTIAMGLAGILASDQEVDVALVDADFDTHSLGEAYQFEARHGLTDVLAGGVALEDALRRIPGTRLDVLAAGAPPSDAGRLASSSRLPGLLDELRESYPHVVLDLPGVLTSASTRTLARSCDGVVVVVEARRTNAMELQQALERLDDSSVLGVVLNQWRARVPGWIERPLGLRR